MNRIKATESIIAKIIKLIILLVGTPLVLFWVWDYIFQFTYIYAIAGMVGILGVPFAVYFVIEKEQRKKVKQFNTYKISE